MWAAFERILCPQPPERVIYDYEAKDIDGNVVQLHAFRGQVLLVVNVASQCGTTRSNYRELVRLYDKYHSQGFSVLAFPCDQFLHQEPWKEERIKTWTHETFGVNFPMFSKVKVNGYNAHPVFQFLRSYFPGMIIWNFYGKFLINRQGIPVRRFSRESWKTIEEAIEQELHAPAEAG